MAGAKIETVRDLTPDPRNANRGTERGSGMLETSLREYGAGRSLLVDKHGVVIAGNKTLEAASSIGFERVRVVETDGSELVVVQRTDLDLAEDARAKALAVADNRVAQVGLEWEPDVLSELVDGGVDLSKMFTDDELLKLIDDEEKAAKPQLDQALQVTPGREYCVVLCDDESEWEEMKGALGLGLVRRGGYKRGSAFDAVGTQRVVRWTDVRGKLATS